MAPQKWVWLGMFALAASCGEPAHNHVTPLECTADTECDDQNACTVDTCLFSHTCAHENVPDGPIPQQTAGDCQRVECVEGALVPTTDDADLSDDGNPCTNDSCANGIPVHPPVPDSTTCINGPNAGVCSSGVCTVLCGPGDACDDLNSCTEDSCDPAIGCMYTPIAAGTPCILGQPEFCDGQGACIECSVPTDCLLLPPDDECQTRTCIDHVCGQTFIPAGAPISLQLPGDCKQIVCDGAGGTSIENNDLDLPEDNNHCTKNLCSNGVPSNLPEPPGTACGFGAECSATGQCSICPPVSVCPGTDDFCKQRACVNDGCGFMFTAAGTDLPFGQTNFDCKVVECDGQGNIVTSVDVNDKPVDGNACTQDACSAQGVPSNPPEPAGTVCNQSGGTMCNGAGMCI